MLHVPAPAPGDGREPGLGVHRHREADGFEHGQVAGRVGVRHRLLEREAVQVCVVGQHQGPRLADGRQRRQVAGQPAVTRLHDRAHDVVEERPYRLDDEVERSRDEQRPVAGGPVRPHPGEPVGEGPGDQLAVEELPRVLPQPIEWCVLEAPVEGAQEVTAVASVQRQQRRSLPEEIRDEARPS